VTQQAHDEAPAPRFLIARFSALGDIVLMQPLVHALRAHCGPEARIDLICLRRSASASQILAGLDDVHLIDRGTAEVVPDLKALRFDYLLDFHGNVRSRSLARQLDAMTLRVDKAAFARWMLLRGWRKEPVRPFVDRCFDVIRPFGIALPSSESHGPDAWGSFHLGDSQADVPGGHLALSLSSSQPGKHLSKAVVNEAIVTASERNVPVVIYGGPAEAERAEAIQADHPGVQLLAGEVDLQTTTAALAVAKALVTGDTATMHLGAGLGVPVGSVWGCTRPSLGLAPWRPHPDSRAFLPEGSSAPCSKHGASCKHTTSDDPFDVRRCGQQIEPLVVRTWLEALF
jgi:ADP-heptose:LPS heptosyltransferase